MSAERLYRDLLDRGLHLRIDDGRLVVGPRRLLTDVDDVAQLTAWKPALLALRACPILGCGQLLPWGEATAHTCRDASQVTPTQTSV